MITSFIPGRVRIRHARLKDPETAANIAALISSHPGVDKAVANPVTGGLLIEYDPAELDLETARQALQTIDPDGADWLEEYEAASRGGQPAEAQPISLNINLDADEGCGGRPPFPLQLRSMNKDAMEYLAMTGAFVVCTGSAALRSKGWHIYSGLTLAGLTVQHIYKYRKRLLAYFNNL